MHDVSHYQVSVYLLDLYLVRTAVVFFSFLCSLVLPFWPECSHCFCRNSDPGSLGGEPLPFPRFFALISFLSCVGVGGSALAFSRLLTSNCVHSRRKPSEEKQKLIYDGGRAERCDSGSCRDRVVVVVVAVAVGMMAWKRDSFFRYTVA